MSVYDPQGIAAPAMLSCKLLQREMFPPKDADPHNTHAIKWDDPIPPIFHKQWDKMLTTCKEVSSKISTYHAHFIQKIMERLFTNNCLPLRTPQISPGAMSSTSGLSLQMAPYTLPSCMEVPESCQKVCRLKDNCLFHEPNLEQQRNSTKRSWK